MSLRIIGYYDHDNTGDEQYKYTISKLFDTSLQGIDFIDCDKIQTIDFKDSDVIIFGGGNVLCDYFVDKLLNVFSTRPNKIIALSVDMPYTEILLKTHKLDRLDYIFLRNKQDYAIFSKFYPKNKIQYMPDLSCLLKEIPFETNMPLKNIKNQRIVSITLCDESLIIEMCKFIVYLIKGGYRVILLPFDRKEDLRVHNIIIDLLPAYSDKITNVPFTNCLDLYSKIKEVDFVLSMRYHGCLFATHHKIPWIALQNTRKIQNLLKDMSWYKFNPFVNGNFNYDKLVDEFEQLVGYSHNYNLPVFTIDKNKFMIDFNKIIATPRVHITSQNIVSLKDKVDTFLIQGIDSETIVKYLVYTITDSLTSVYNHGMIEKINKSDYNFINEISWVTDDYFKNTVFKSDLNTDLVIPIPNFNLVFKNQNDISGVHRSGWKYVYDSLIRFNYEKSDVLLDLYVDETFHWNHKIYKLLEIIPYKQNWFGFIHHTFNESFSEYNCKNLLKNEDFVTSLIYCKGLIVLSQYLKNILVNELLKIGMKIPVYVICHPTQEPYTKFTLNKFLTNKHKKIINVGTWLRNVHSFYKLTVNLEESHSRISRFFARHRRGSDISIKKAVLVGKHSANYFPTDTFLKDIKHFLITKQDKIDVINHTTLSHNCSHHALKNNWYLHLYDDLKNCIKSVELIDFQEDDEYDHLLAENIVFTNVIDCSAINTLVECVIRHTPIVINPHPAVVEILGPKYPLYFDPENDKKLKLNVKRIKKAHIYLQKLDKTNLRIETFIAELNKVIKGAPFN